MEDRLITANDKWTQSAKGSYKDKPTAIRHLGRLYRRETVDKITRTKNQIEHITGKITYFI